MRVIVLRIPCPFSRKIMGYMGSKLCFERTWDTTYRGFRLGKSPCDVKVMGYSFSITASRTKWQAVYLPGSARKRTFLF